jgi:hypothetical protein
MNASFTATKKRKSASALFRKYQREGALQRTKVLRRKSLPPRRLIQQLQQHLMQLRILLYIIHLYQLDESRERRLGMHHLEDGIVFAMPSIVEQKRRDYVKCRIVVLL